MTCPRCHQPDCLVVHRCGRDPVLDVRCGHCHRVFNAVTGTALHGNKRRPRELVLILRGSAQSVPTAQLDCDRSERLTLRHRLLDLAFRNPDNMPLETVVRREIWPMTTVNTDEWCGSNGLPEMGRSRATVCHAEREWARDDDGDGIREVHNHTLEGLWTGLRNVLRPFRGVNKVYLSQYAAMFEWGHNVKRATEAFVWALPGVRSATICPA